MSKPYKARRKEWYAAGLRAALQALADEDAGPDADTAQDAGDLWRAAALAAELEQRRARAARALRPVFAAQVIGTGGAAAGLAVAGLAPGGSWTAWLRSLAPAASSGLEQASLLFAALCAALALAAALRPDQAS